MPLLQNEEAIMSEMVAFRQGISMPSKDTVLRYVVDTLNQLNALEPPLHILPWPGGNPAESEKRLMYCYEAGERKRYDALAGILPQPVWMQGIALLCFAAGYMNTHGQALTQNRLCDLAKEMTRDFPQFCAELTGGFPTVRSIALPVLRRLQRDGHPPRIMLLQTLLHLIAWRSDSLYARQQAQRLLWMGGLLGEEGEKNLLKLDKALREESVGEESLPALLIFTHFLAYFPAGPIFVD